MAMECACGVPLDHGDSPRAEDGRREGPKRNHVDETGINGFAAENPIQLPVELEEPSRFGIPFLPADAVKGDMGNPASGRRGG